jgi:hypothetical protein
MKTKLNKIFEMPTALGQSKGRPVTLAELVRLKNRGFVSQVFDSQGMIVPIDEAIFFLSENGKKKYYLR